MLTDMDWDSLAARAVEAFRHNGVPDMGPPQTTQYNITVMFKGFQGGGAQLRPHDLDPKSPGQLSPGSVQLFLATHSCPPLRSTFAVRETAVSRSANVGT